MSAVMNEYLNLNENAEVYELISIFCSISSWSGWFV